MYRAGLANRNRATRRAALVLVPLPLVTLPLVTLLLAQRRGALANGDPMKKAGLTASGILLLVVAGCGVDPTPAQTPEGIKIVSSMATALTDPGQGIEKADAICFATGYVNDQGTAKLVADKVVTAGDRYIAGAVAPTTAKPNAFKAFSRARARCLEAKIAKSMAGVIVGKGGLVPKADAGCVARNFTSAVGLDRLVAGQVSTTTYGYVSNGAIQDPANAAAYANALNTCIGKKAVALKMQATMKAAFAAGPTGIPVGDPGCLARGFFAKVGARGMLANQLIGDTGAFAPLGQPRYDAASVKTLAGSILTCFDALKSEATADAKADPTLNATVLEACLKQAVSADYLRDAYLVNLLLNNKLAQAAAAVIQTKTQMCEHQQKAN
jgi:hypothetical protein